MLVGSPAASNITEEGAMIADGDTASERRFLSLDFTRRGSWG